MLPGLIHLIHRTEFTTPGRLERDTISSSRCCIKSALDWHPVRVVTDSSPATGWSDGYAARVDRITVNPKQMGGVPCIRGLRIPVATVVNLVANGMTPSQVVGELPPLELEDVAAALRFAADAVADREIPLQPTA